MRHGVQSSQSMRPPSTPFRFSSYNSENRVADQWPLRAHGCEAKSFRTADSKPVVRFINQRRNADVVASHEDDVKSLPGVSEPATGPSAKALAILTARHCNHLVGSRLVSIFAVSNSAKRCFLAMAGDWKQWQNMKRVADNRAACNLSHRRGSL
jgi:hypothetical protein